MNEHIREGRGSIPGLFAQPRRRGVGAPEQRGRGSIPNRFPSIPPNVVQTAYAVKRLTHPCDYSSAQVVYNFQNAWNAWAGNNTKISANGKYGPETYEAMSIVIYDPPAFCGAYTNWPRVRATGTNHVGVGDWLDAVRQYGLGDDTMDPTAGADPNAGSYPGEITSSGVSTPIDPSTDPGSSASYPPVIQSTGTSTPVDSGSTPAASVTQTTTTTYPPSIQGSGTSTPIPPDNTSLYVAAGGIAAAAGLWWWLAHRKR